MSFNIKKGDRSPGYSVTLEAPAGTPVDLTGTSVKFIMTLDDGVTTTPKIDAVATIDDEEAGEVTYSWGATDTNTAGLYRAEWEVTFAGSIKRTFPADGFLYINVIGDLA